jgi:hypothetical protein
MSAAEFHVSLTPFANSPTGPVRAIYASGCLNPSGRLELDYTLWGDVNDIALPAPAGAPGRRDELWRHSCCEVFARPGMGAPEGKPSGKPYDERYDERYDEPYFEWNFSPSGDWAAYAFAAYRESRVDLQHSQPACHSRQPRPDALVLTAAANLPDAPPRTSPRTSPGWRLNIAAVVEDRAGALSYWALSHPRAYPDFHDRAAFTLTLC